MAGRSLVLDRWVVRRLEGDGWKEVARGRRDRMTARDFRGRRDGGHGLTDGGGYERIRPGLLAQQPASRINDHMSLFFGMMHSICTLQQ